jgi:hypothetical protein
MRQLRTLRIPTRQAREIDPDIAEVATMAALSDRGEINWSRDNADTFYGTREVKPADGWPYLERYWIGEASAGMWMTRAELCHRSGEERVKARIRPWPGNRTGSRSDARKVQDTLRQLATDLDRRTRQAPIPIRSAAAVA